MCLPGVGLPGSGTQTRGAAQRVLVWRVRAWRAFDRGGGACWDIKTGPLLLAVLASHGVCSSGQKLHSTQPPRITLGTMGAQWCGRHLHQLSAPAQRQAACVEQHASAQTHVITRRKRRLLSFAASNRACSLSWGVVAWLGVGGGGGGCVGECVAVTFCCRRCPRGTHVSLSPVSLPVAGGPWPHWNALFLLFSGFVLLLAYLAQLVNMPLPAHGPPAGLCYR